MRSFIKRFFIFLVLLQLSNYPLAIFFSKNFNTYKKQNWILNKIDQSYDYAALGSSRVLNMIDINTIDSICGTQGINIGTSGSNFAENHLILDNFLKQNTIRNLILNVDEFSFNSKNSFGNYPFHYFEFLPYFTDKKYNEAFKDYLPAWKYYLYKLIPISKYVEFNDSFTTTDAFVLNYDKKKGTELLGKEPSEINFQKRRHIAIDSLDIKYFNKIVTLCNNNNVNIILCTTPIHAKPNSNSKWLSFIQSTCNIQNFDYLPYTKTLDYSNPDFFNDISHTNTQGSLEYSKKLGIFLKQSLK